MAITLKGVMQAPVTPLKDDFSFDGDGFAKMVDFHIRNGAPAIAWPHHKAESLNLTIAERKLGAEIAVKTAGETRPGFDLRRDALGRRFARPGEARPEDRRGPDPDDLAILPATLAGGDLRFDRPDRHPYRPAASDLQLPLAQRRRGGIHRRADEAPDRSPPQLHRDEGRRLPQREVSRNLPGCAEDAARVLDHHRRRTPPAGLPARRVRLFLLVGSHRPQPLQQVLRIARGKRLGSGARLSIQDLAALAPVQGAVSLIAQRGDDHDGPAGRAYPLAAAHRDQGTDRVPAHAARGARHSADGTARLVTFSRLIGSVASPPPHRGGWKAHREEKFQMMREELCSNPF